MEPLDEQKARLRRAMRSVRAGFDARALGRASRSIAERAKALAQLRASRIVATYLAIRRELPTEPLRDVLVGVRWAIPRIEGEAMVMVAHDGPLVDGAHGIPTCAGPPVRVDAVVVPGLAFDPQGRRLGWGGGYYDRYLAMHPAFTVGVALDEAIVEEVPSDEHDRRVDVVVTPTRVLVPDRG